MTRVRAVLGSGRRAHLLMLVLATAVTETKRTAEIVYPRYLAGYGCSLSVIGFLTSIVGGAQLVSRVPAGVSYRAQGAKRQYALALVVFGISTLDLSCANGQFGPVVALSVLHGRLRPRLEWAENL